MAKIIVMQLSRTDAFGVCGACVTLVFYKDGKRVHEGVFSGKVSGKGFIRTVELPEHDVVQADPVEYGVEFLYSIDYAAPWNGEGLPPVGLEFEVLWSSECTTYVRAKAVAHDEGRVVFRFLDGERAGEYQAERVSTYNGGALCNFRPIRTAEQIAADKRMHEIRNALTAIKAGQQQFPNDLVRGNIVAVTVEAMIDAGYRRQAPQ